MSITARTSLLLLAALPLALACPKQGGSTAEEAAPVPAAPVPGATELPGIGPEATFTLPGVERFSLSNGIPVIAARYGSIPTVNVWLVFRDGAAADPIGSEGLTRLTADMLNEGTAQRTGLELSDALEVLATDMGSGASLDNSYLSINALTEKLPESLALMREVLMEASFPEEELERLRDGYQASVLQRQSDPSSTARLLRNRMIFGNDYAGRPLGGTTESIESITIEQIRARYVDVVRPDQAFLIVTGDVDTTSLQAQLEETFGDWAAPAGSSTDDAEAASPAEAMPQPEGRSIHYIPFEGATQSSVVAVRVGPSMGPDGFFPAMLMNKVFGGLFVSRLNMNLREEKGYTYGARSGFVRYHEGGLWVASASVQSQFTAATMEELDREIRDILGDRPVTQDEYQLAVQNTLRGFPSQVASSGALASKLMEQELHELPGDWIGSYTQSAVDTPIEDVAAAAGNYMDADNLYYIVVGPPEELPAIEALGWGEISTYDRDANPVE